MAKKQKTPEHYRKLKKVLNDYQKFNFKMPPKGKDFTRQQKAAITKAAKKIGRLIRDPSVSYIKYPKNSKLANVDGVRTKKGLFYKFPDSKAIYDKKTKKYQITIAPTGKRKDMLNARTRKDVFYPFPKSVINNPQKIIEFVNAIRAKNAGAFVRWSTPNKRTSAEYDEKLFTFYFSLFVLPDGDNEIDDSGEGEPEEIFDEEEVITMPDHTSDRIWRKRKFETKLGDADGYYNGVFVVKISG